MKAFWRCDWFPHFLVGGMPMWRLWHDGPVDAGHQIGWKRARFCCLHTLGELLAVLHAENQRVDRQRQRVAVRQDRGVDVEFGGRGRRNPSARA